MNVDRHTYTVTWSDEHGEHVGLCAEFPSLSWLAQTPEEALAGIRRIVAESIEDMRASKHIGSRFDDFLREEGIYGEVTAAAMQRVREWHAKEAGRAVRVTRVPHTRAPGFAEECARQSRVIAENPGEKDIMELIERITEDEWK